MKIHLLSGFLGSGKTTAIQHACYSLLQQNITVGVITNDQGIKLVDSNFFDGLHIPNRKVIGGCFCCNYNDLDASIQSLIETNNPDIIFAESVGSCTDIVATVLKPLQHLHKDVQVTISTFADVQLLQMILSGNNLFDETVRYIYHKQLEEAAVIIVNKTDLISTEELENVKQLLQHAYSAKTVLYLNATDADDIQQWLHIIDQAVSNPLSSLEINYDLYGAGEAKLAWLDEELVISNTDKKAMQSAIDLANTIYRKIQRQQYPVGHLKFLINNHIKLSYTETTQPENTFTGKDEPTATLLINARVQTTPEELNGLVKAVIQEIEATTNTRITINSIVAFQPGYPQPTYRISD